MLTESMKNWKEKPRILIVDDDGDFISDMKILLSSEFTVDGATGTQQASDMLFEAPPDCLLLDLNMPVYFSDHPDNEGLSFLRYIRRDSDIRCANEIPVIVLTARQGLEEMDLAKEYGIASLYQKPPDIKKLKTSIWHLIEGRYQNPS